MVSSLVSMAETDQTCLEGDGNLRTETSVLFGNDANASNDSLTLMKPVV